MLISYSGQTRQSANKEVFFSISFFPVDVHCTLLVYKMLCAVSLCCDCRSSMVWSNPVQLVFDLHK